MKESWIKDQYGTYISISAGIRNDGLRVEGTQVEMFNCRTIGNEKGKFATPNSLPTSCV